MGRSEYMRIHVRLIPPDIIAHLKLNDLVDQDGWIYMEIIIGIYGLLKRSFLQTFYSQIFINHLYCQVKQTPEFWINFW